MNDDDATLCRSCTTDLGDIFDSLGDVVDIPEELRVTCDGCGVIIDG